MKTTKSRALLLCLMILTGCHGKDTPSASKKMASEQVLRAHRIELTDDAGRVRAVVGFANDSSQPEVTLMNEKSEPAASLSLNQRGNATMIFNDPDGPEGRTIGGRVSLGYLWGSDCCYKPGEYDPLGSWGLKILTKDRRGYLAHRDLTLIDPNEKDFTKFAGPPVILQDKIPKAFIPQDKTSDAHR